MFNEDIIVIEDFFSKSAFNDFERILSEPKWQIVNNISAPYNIGMGLQRTVGDEKESFYLSLYPVHVISKFLDKEYYCVRMRMRAVWPNDNTGSEPHIDEPEGPENVDASYDISAVVYMNDSDGDLIIYDQIGYEPLPIRRDVQSIRVTPKRNTCVIMMKKYYHHALWPINSPMRYCLNINLKETQ